VISKKKKKKTLKSFQRKVFSFSQLQKTLSKSLIKKKWNEKIIFKIKIY